MALTPIVVPPYPDVPVAPGVPPVLRSLGFAVTPSPQPLSGDSAAIAALQAAGSSGAGASPQWGIFDTAGNPVLVPDSIVAVSDMAEYRVSDYPVEGGLFQSFNKVATPFEVRVTMTKGGAVADKTDFLHTLDGAIAGVELFDVYTPEISFPGVTLTHYDYSRKAEAGVTLLTVDVWTQQVRTTVSAAFSSSKVQNPSSADVAQDGAVQGQTPTATHTAAAAILVQNAAGVIG